MNTFLHMFCSFLFQLIFINQLYFINLLLQIPFTANGNHYRLYLRLGSPTFHNNYIFLDITSPQTYFHLSWGIYERSNTLKIIKPICSLSIHKNNNIRAIEASDLFQLGEEKEEINITDTHFYLIVEDNVFLKNEAIGLSFKLEQTSIMSQLNNKGLLDSLSFSFVNVTSGKSLLIFGGIPQEIINNKHSTQCKVNRGLNEWNCYLNRIIINQTTIEANCITLFSTVASLIYTPESVFNEIYEIYFKTALDERNCRINFQTSFKYMISCKNEYISQLPNISFVIDDYLYSLSSNQLFDCNYKSCSFMVFSSENPIQWIIGVPFLKHFDILFDYEKEMIYFYSDSIIQKVGSIQNKNNWFRYIFIVCLIVLSLGIVLMIKYKFDKSY